MSEARLIDGKVLAATQRDRVATQVAALKERHGLTPGLAVVLVGIARNAERKTDRLLDTMLKLMEPAMLLLLAGAVMFIFMALVVPMMSLSSQID